MSYNLFQFKQFTVQQNLSAMKVGTDGVLLGAWVTPKEGNLLDIGTGTGLLSLMLAQRTVVAQIDAIDIDESAYQQALINVNESKWKERIRVYHSALQDYKSSKKYDLIFSNPPYFVNSSKTTNVSRNRARHTDDLPFDELVCLVKYFLKEDGLFALILPVNEASSFVDKALQQELFLIRRCFVIPNIHKKPKRVLLEFAHQYLPLKEEEITIETEKRHQYTKEYINLTQDFYLNF